MANVNPIASYHPVTSCQQLGYDETTKVDEKCRICLEKIEELAGVVAHSQSQNDKLAKLFHPAHEKCMAKWLLRVATCPECKTQIDLSSNKEVAKLIHDETVVEAMYYSAIASGAGAVVGGFVQMYLSSSFDEAVHIAVIVTVIAMLTIGIAISPLTERQSIKVSAGISLASLAVAYQNSLPYLAVGKILFGAGIGILVYKLNCQDNNDLSGVQDLSPAIDDEL